MTGMPGWQVGKAEFASMKDVTDTSEASDAGVIW